MSGLQIPAAVRRNNIKLRKTEGLLNLLSKFLDEGKYDRVVQFKQGIAYSSKRHFVVGVGWVDVDV